MAIHSTAFGRVTLTKDDAEKFSRQVKYGRGNAAAKLTVKRGKELNAEFKKKGKVTVTLRRKEKVG